MLFKPIIYSDDYVVTAVKNYVSIILLCVLVL